MRGSAVIGRAPRVSQRLVAGARERAAADLHDRPVDASTPAASGELVAEGRAAFDREAVEVPLAGERQRPGGDRLREAEVRSGRRARRPSRSQTSTSAPSSSSRATTTGSASAGTKTRSRRPAGRGDARRRRARRCRSLRSRGRASRRIGQPSRSAHLELEQDVEQMAGLVRAGDVAGLVLDPDAALRREKPSAVAELVARAANGVATKPCPSTAATRSSSARTSAQNASSERPPASATWYGCRSAR